MCSPNAHQECNKHSWCTSHGGPWRDFTPRSYTITFTIFLNQICRLVWPPNSKWSPTCLKQLRGNWAQIMSVQFVLRAGRMNVQGLLCTAGKNTPSLCLSFCQIERNVDRKLIDVNLPKMLFELEVTCYLVCIGRTTTSREWQHFSVFKVHYTRNKPDLGIMVIKTWSFF